MNRNKLLIILTLVLITILSIACQQEPVTEKVIEKNAAVFPKGNPAGNKIFTNKVWVQMLETDKDKNYDTQVYNVTFEPGGRTYWHSHPGGQILLVTSGKGYYQEKDKPAQQLNPGDVVSIPPNVVHWHGAAPESEFVHLGMSTQVHLGPAEWFGPVTEEEYSNL